MSHRTAVGVFWKVQLEQTPADGTGNGGAVGSRCGCAATTRGDPAGATEGPDGPRAKSQTLQSADVASEKAVHRWHSQLKQTEHVRPAPAAATGSGLVQWGQVTVGRSAILRPKKGLCEEKISLFDKKFSTAHTTTQKSKTSYSNAQRIMKGK